MEQFLCAMDRVEADLLPDTGPRLAERMRESWTSKRFWFNLAARNSFHLDGIYWKFLHDDDGENGTTRLMDWDSIVSAKEMVRDMMEANAAYEEELENQNAAEGL